MSIDQFIDNPQKVLDTSQLPDTSPTTVSSDGDEASTRDSNHDELPPDEPPNERIRRLEEHIDFLRVDHDGEVDCLWREIRVLQDQGVDTARIVSVSRGIAKIEDAQGQRYKARYDEDMLRQLTPGREVYTNAQRTYIHAVRSPTPRGPVAHVSKLLDQGRVMIERGGYERVVFGAKGLRAGDEVILGTGEKHILEVIRHASPPSVELPAVEWSAIGGLDHVVNEVQQVVELPYLYPDVFANYPLVRGKKGVLLYGPPGCGKTLLAKIVASTLGSKVAEKTGTEARGRFLYMNGPEFFDKWLGGSEAKVRALFGPARDLAKDGSPLVIYIDELDSVGRERGQGENSLHYDTVVNQLLVELDGMNDLGNVVCMASTNREKLLDSALLRRWDHKIYVPRPSRKEAESIFSIYLGQVALGHPEGESDGFSSASMAKTITDSLFSHPRPIARIVYWEEPYDLVNFSDVLSGALIKDMVYRAALRAITREVNGGSRGVSPDDLEQAVQTVYEEHKHFPNLVTDYDKRKIAGSKYDKVMSVEPMTSSGILLP